MFDLFYGEVKFASLCICMGSILLIIKNDFFSEAVWQMLLKFHMESPWGRGKKDC